MSGLLGWLESVGRSVRFAVVGVGAATRFLLAGLLAILPLFARPALVSSQLFRVGVRSFLIIAVAGLFVGMVLALQGYNTLVDFGAEESLGVAVAKALTRELGPVISALLFAGRAGSALTAEVGLMRATHQFDALEMMGIDPLRRVIAPRLAAGIIALPLLACVFTAIGILGGYLVGVLLLGVDGGAYWSQMQASVPLVEDVVNGVLIKSGVFAVVVTAIALYQGNVAVPTSEGVGDATTRTVVHGSLAVLGLDFLLTALMFTS